MEKESGGGGGPFQGLEYRVGFMDIRVCGLCVCVNGDSCVMEGEGRRE